MAETRSESQNMEEAPGERAFAYRVLRYAPNLVRDEWVNIGVLLFAPETGERRLRLIEEQEEFNRVRRLHPQADEALLRRLRDHLEDRFQSANGTSGNGHDWQTVLAKWDETLSNAVQLAPQKGTLAQDLDTELERLYADHVALHVELTEGNPRHRFVRDALRDAGVEPVPLDHFAVWVSKLKPLLQ